tara:strand:- start:1014 stop:1244 length:231 start_codon:yes stop_codon:yes gene_type:complete
MGLQARGLNPDLMDDPEFRHLRLCAARMAWPQRFQRTPSGKYTWGEWFRRKFGISLDKLRKTEGSGASDQAVRPAR